MCFLRCLFCPNNGRRAYVGERCLRTRRVDAGGRSSCECDRCDSYDPCNNGCRNECCCEERCR